MSVLGVSSCRMCLLFSLRPPPPTSPLFPYTTLFRSRLDVEGARRAPGVVAVVAGAEVRHLGPLPVNRLVPRSEEHTSELQSRLHLVCRLLLEKQKTPAPTDGDSAAGGQPAALRAARG